MQIKGSRGKNLQKNFINSGGKLLMSQNSSEEWGKRLLSYVQCPNCMLYILLDFLLSILLHV